MTTTIRVALLATFVAASAPKVAAGQATSIDSIVRRVAILESKVASLEQRVRELEAVLTAAPSPSMAAPEAPDSRDVANWRRLSRGMTMDQVRALLGEPGNVQTFPYFTFWLYPNGASVDFDSANKVKGWMEP